MLTEQSQNIPPEPQPKQKLTYNAADTAYAWLSLLLAFWFSQAMPVTKYPLSGFLLIIVLFISGFVILRLKKLSVYPVCIFSVTSALVIGAALLLTDDELLIGLSFSYSLVSYGYFLYAAFDNRIEKGFSNYIYIDLVKVLFLLPFRSLGSIFSALAGSSGKKSSGFLLRILFGIAIAILPTIAVFLFLSYDPDFLELLGKIFSFDSREIGRFLRSLIFTLPLAMYGFGLYAASREKLLHDKISAQSCGTSLKKLQILPQLTTLVAVLPILFLYIVFFISQWKYYISGFTGILPQDLSHAEYARQGFFELCAVSVINLAMIIGISLFIKRSKSDRCVILKIVTVVFCLCTLILISTAVAKLIMYIDSYGLTQKRIYAMWLMVTIAIVFLLIALGQFLKRFKTVALCVVVVIAMFAGLAVCNVNALCARYNADRYLSGTLQILDVDAMAELGESAIPSLVQVANSIDAEKEPELYQQIDAILRAAIAHREKEDPSIFSFSLPSTLADAALEDYVPGE